jgi:PAS domain S-box-containing protein
MEEPVDILLVDDRPRDLEAIALLLADPLHRVVTAQSAKQALKRVLEQDFAVILLDVLMPGTDGFEVASLIKGRDRSRDTPILFLTAAGADMSFIYRAYSVGAVDYLPKPIDRDVLRAKVGIFVDLFRKDRRLREQAEALRAADRRAQELEVARLKLASQKRYRNLAEAIPQIVWTATPDGALDFCNANWVELTGLSREASLGVGWLGAVHPDDLERCRALWQRALSSGEVFETECRLRGRDGGYRWHLGRAVPERDENAAVVGWLGTYTDFDDLKRAQAEAEAARRRIELVADASALLSSSLDAGETLHALAGRLVPEWADWCAVELVDGEAALAGVGAAVHRDAEKEGALHELLRRLPLGSGDRTRAGQVVRTGRAELIADPESMLGDAAQLEELGYSSAMLAPLRTRGRVLGVLTLAVGAPRRYLAADLRVAEELARRIAMALDNMILYREAQQAVSARDEFLSIASHELRTPLTALQMQVEGLYRMAHGAEERWTVKGPSQKTEIARRQIFRLTRLVDSLLDVARIDTGHLELVPEDLDLVAVVREVVERHGDEASQAECVLSFQAAAPAQGFWDRLRMEQVVTNLLSNALKYARGTPIEISVERDDGSVRLIVRDHGIGIPQEQLGRIFGRFARAASARQFGGLGMGLYITKQIVEAHGGTIRGESEPGQGATFIVELPRRAVHVNVA